MKPAFLIALMVLLWNDWYLKVYHPSWVSGKLSDFAGILAFALFWTTFLPKRKIIVVCSIALLFVFWKSSLSNGFIAFWNDFAPYQLSRKVDYWDLLALVVLPIVFLEDRREYTSSPRIGIVTLGVAAFAFGATSYEQNYDYTEKYSFDFSKQELIERLNSIQFDSLVSPSYIPVSLYIDHQNYVELSNENDSIYYYISGYSTWSDTLINEDGSIDEIITYSTPMKDTVYVNPSGVLLLQIPAKESMPESTTSYCSYVDTRVIVKGDDQRCSITLKKIYTSNCMGIFEKEASQVEEKNLKFAFESEIIQRLK